MPEPTIGDLAVRALEAYAALTSLGEDVEDEWSYVQDLAGAWRPALERASTRGAVPAEPSTVAAVDRLVDEVGRITDPHRAIDWMSTFPQAVLLSLGADPWASEP
jgi:hypothetical protein